MTLAIIFRGFGGIIGFPLGYLMRLAIQGSANERIKKLIRYAVGEFVEKTNMTWDRKGCPEPDSSADKLQTTQEALLSLRNAMLNQKGDEESIQEFLAAYDQKKVRAALSKLQLRAGGKFAKS